MNAINIMQTIFMTLTQEGKQISIVLIKYMDTAPLTKSDLEKKPLYSHQIWPKKERK